MSLVRYSVVRVLLFLFRFCYIPVFTPTQLGLLLPFFQFPFFNLFGALKKGRFFNAPSRLKKGKEKLKKGTEAFIFQYSATRNTN